MLDAGQALSVLHISHYDNYGGSARSAYKIHLGLRESGVRSKMLVGTKVTDDPDVARIHGNRRVLRCLDAVGTYIVDRLGWQYLFYPSSFTLAQHPWFQAADVVQLYNIHGGFFSFEALPLLSRRRPIVWRLSDMWPLTGHCSYSYDCERWMNGCGTCPLLDEYPELSRDTTAFLWRRKRSAYKRSDLVIVTTNGWMEKLVSQSPLLGDYPRHCIPNGVDTKVFRPMSRHSARDVLGVPKRAHAVLFAAHNTSAARKGGEIVPAVMAALVARGVRDLVLIVVGEGAESWRTLRECPVLVNGLTNSDRLMAIFYSAADVLLCPTLAENLPNTVIESMACGTPVVAFEAGGVAEAVRHLQTGYLAGRGNVERLAEGVHMLLSDGGLHERLSASCRRVAETEYANEIQVRRFVELYSSIKAQSATHQQRSA